MSDTVSNEELHAHTDEVLTRVLAGERLRVTANGEPVAEIVPANVPWTPKAEYLPRLRHQADPGLTRDLADALPDIVEDL
ncbi:MAG: type II toxin-antitoxin system Phd/YefM family antitoxin [Pseudonocardiaceae bacterium]